MSELVDVGYRDPWDERDDEPDPPPSPDEYDDDVPERAPAAREQPPPSASSIAMTASDQLELLAQFGTGMEQVLARQELARRADGGYQPSLLGPIGLRGPAAGFNRAG